MLYAWIDGIKRQPLAKGERTSCRDCGRMLTAVMPVENVSHWRHKAGDCDPWSEPESPWHLRWKEHFDPSCCEIGLINPVTGEQHRADILCGAGTARATVLELQHSTISEDERIAREAFYRQGHRMFWLVHLHDETSFNGTSFRLSRGMVRHTATIKGRTFEILHWASRSSQFIEKWKRSSGHVFFDFQGHIFFLAGETVAREANGGEPLKRGYFVLCPLTRQDFVCAVKGTE